MRRFPIDGDELSKIRAGQRNDALVHVERGQGFTIGERVVFAEAEADHPVGYHFIDGGQAVEVTVTKVRNADFHYLEGDLCYIAW